jgi:D-alanyl-D-alanine-carboxypeptidase/D-alanyl-D-alanine-endopeptidase
MAETDPRRSSHFPADAAIQTILAERIDARHQGVGIVLGIIEGTRRRLFSYGRFGNDHARKLDADTLFELGSVTKVYTALLLADMVRRREVALDEPVQALLPAHLQVLARTHSGHPITLHDLASHTSGMPPMPANFVDGASPDPYAHYFVDDLHQFLATRTLIRKSGARYRYSNVGFGLLGHALSCRAATDYESLLRERILLPLGLDSTAIVLSDRLKGRFAQGHDLKLEPAPAWNVGEPFAGAGALRSTVNDQLTFMEAMLGLRRSRLDAAIHDTISVQRSRGERARKIGLGWGVDVLNGDEIISHGGETAGHSALLIFLRRAGVGVVVLANSKFKIADIGFHLIDRTIPLSAPNNVRT